MKNIVVVVADLGIFKAFQLHHSALKTPRLELVREIAPSEGHGRFMDKVTDQAGRYHAPTNGKWSTPWGEKHNIELEQRKRQIKHLADEIRSIAEKPEVEGVYLAASREINAPLVEELNGQLRSKIIKNVHADLTKVDKTDLIARFEE